MWYVYGNGTNTASIGSEQTLTSAYVNGTCILVVSTANMQAGDVVELRVYVGGYQAGLSQIGPSPCLETLVFSPPVVSVSTFSATLKQVKGSPRTYAWKLLGDGPKPSQPRQFSSAFSADFG